MLSARAHNARFQLGDDYVKLSRPAIAAFISLKSSSNHVLVMNIIVLKSYSMIIQSKSLEENVQMKTDERAVISVE